MSQKNNWREHLGHWFVVLVLLIGAAVATEGCNLTPRPHPIDNNSSFTGGNTETQTDGDGKITTPTGSENNSNVTGPLPTSGVDSSLDAQTTCDGEPCQQGADTANSDSDTPDNDDEEPDIDDEFDSDDDPIDVDEPDHP